jgi:hypothetical protein
MPLSEYELRVIAEIEEDLAIESASTAQRRRRRRRAVSKYSLFGLLCAATVAAAVLAIVTDLPRLACAIAVAVLATVTGGYSYAIWFAHRTHVPNPVDAKTDRRRLSL